MLIPDRMLSEFICIQNKGNSVGIQWTVAVLGQLSCFISKYINSFLLEAGLSHIF